MTHVYRGQRHRRGVTVTVDGQPLAPRRDLHNHSPTGFEWGYRGSGPAQLALAILAHHGGANENRALQWYQDFKMAFIASLDGPTWVLTSESIEQYLRTLESTPAEPTDEDPEQQPGNEEDRRYG